MANKKMYSICAVNIRLHPHPEGAYEKLFRSAMELKRSVSVHGMTHVIMTEMRSDEMAGRAVISGMLAKYTKVDLDGRWFNESTLKSAEYDEILKISIPDYLQPNLSEFRFAFFLDKHVLFVEFESDGGKLTPALVEKYLIKLFSTDAIKRVFNLVEVTLIPSSNVIAEMFSIAEVRRAEIFIRRPNPDDFEEIDDDDFDAQLLEEMNAQGVSEKREFYFATPGSSIRPNAKTRRLAEMAARNGHVVVHGRNAQGGRVDLSTKDGAVAQILNRARLPFPHINLR
ncbi:DUF4747 family protein, partial [Chromobacterium violaceum]|uniref:DUF4747 family protein n=1 Tax=Chromobacterium violaceum TaxID=536 RepID=UPI000DF329A1